MISREINMLPENTNQIKEETFNSKKRQSLNNVKQFIQRRERQSLQMVNLQNASTIKTQQQIYLKHGVEPEHSQRHKHFQVTKTKPKDSYCEDEPHKTDKIPHLKDVRSCNSISDTQQWIKPI